MRRNYKIAVPQYFITEGTIQLLIPLCLAAQDVADLAIVVEDYGNMYRASTCLTLDQAMNNARLLARPDRDCLILDAVFGNTMATKNQIAQTI